MNSPLVNTGTKAPWQSPRSVAGSTDEACRGFLATQGTGSRRSRIRISRRNRNGLSLLEVILAIAILGGALAVIGELVRLGSLAAGRAENLSKAQLIADTRMAELSSGAIPLQSVSEAPCEEDPDWVYTVNVGETGRIGLLNVEVVVQQEPTKYARPLSIKLTRWIADPDYIQEVYDAAEAEETTW